MERNSQKHLYRQFYAYGMSICIRYADNRDEAAEILNDGFMKVFKHIKKFDLSRPFKPWLRRIMINTAINYYHQKQRLGQMEDLEKAQFSVTEETAISGIQYTEIIGMLRKLSPAYRTAFNLYVIEGFKHEEIATMLGISVGTSKSNLFKAKEQLRRILSCYFEIENVAQR